MSDAENDRLLARDARLFGVNFTDVTGERIDPLEIEGAVSDEVRRLAGDIMEQAYAMLPTLSVYYHSGLLPRDADGKLAR